MYIVTRVSLLFLICLYSSQLGAQLCTGSLGDPVVNITFGTGNSSGSNFVPPAAYTYTSSTCPNDGSYTITGSTSGCFGGNWHSVGADHTGNGNFMLVNASYTPGDFFSSTVNNLCPNTTYEFAAWIMNVLKSNGIMPDLTFRIEKPDGTILGQYATGPIAGETNPRWLQYGFFFTTPPDNPAILLRITNNAPGGNGNDLALDDITFRPCGPAVTATISGTTGNISACVYDQLPVALDADPSGYYLAPEIQWQLSTDSGSNWVNISGANQTTYTRTATAAGHFWYRFNVAETGSPAQCRINSNILQFDIWPKPLVNAGPDRVLLKGDSVVLSGIASTGASYQWSPSFSLSDALVLQPKAAPLFLTTYQLEVISAEGCINEDQVTVNVINDIYIPTAFTPNNDGLNDSWRIPFLDPDWQPVVKVFDRAGQLVYQANGPGISWDGRFRGVEMSAGVYTYLLSLARFNRIRKGTITLIR